MEHITYTFRLEKEERNALAEACTVFNTWDEHYMQSAPELLAPCMRMGIIAGWHGGAVFARK